MPPLLLPILPCPLWNPPAADVEPLNPGLVYTRVSGYGQTGPYARRPGFASACEAMGGLRHVNGFPGGASVRPNLSLGDTLAGSQAALGTVMALLARERGRLPGGSGGGGQTVDASIVEAVFSNLEGVLPEYSGCGAVRGPSGTSVSGIVPTGTYTCSDGVAVVVGANSNALFRRLAKVMAEERFHDDALYGSNALRVGRQAEIDAAIESWTGRFASAQVLAMLDGAEIPNGKIYSIADFCDDPHVQERGMIETVTIEDDGAPGGPWELEIPAVTPRLSKTPGGTSFPGRSRPGQDTVDVLERVLGMSESEIVALVEGGFIAAQK